MLSVSGIDVDALRQAAQWYATLRADDVTEDDRRQWQAWLALDPAHAKAWQRIESVSRRFAPLHDAGAPKAAVAGVKAARRIAPGRRHMLRSIAGTVGVGFAGWLAWRHTPLPGLMVALQADHHTAIGEQREIRLEDGTRLWLNTASAVDIAYQASTRTVILRSGEIFIETASDGAGRPFYVQTPCGRIQALGTRFAVRRAESHVRVDVFDGLVEIRNDAGLVQRVPAGRGTRFDAGKIAAVEAADPAREAWTRGIVMANDIPLEQLVGELARHWRGHIGVAPDVANLKVMGVYPAADIDRALAMMESELPVRIHRALPWWITVESR